MSQDRPSGLNDVPEHLAITSLDHLLQVTGCDDVGALEAVLSAEVSEAPVVMNLHHTDPGDLHLDLEASPFGGALSYPFTITDLLDRLDELDEAYEEWSSTPDD